MLGGENEVRRYGQNSHRDTSPTSPKKFSQLSRAGIKTAENELRSEANQELGQRLGKLENPFPLFPPRVTQLFSQPRSEFSVFPSWLPGMDSNHD